MDLEVLNNAEFSQEDIDETFSRKNTVRQKSLQAGGAVDSGKPEDWMNSQVSPGHAKAYSGPYKFISGARIGRKRKVVSVINLSLATGGRTLRTLELDAVAAVSDQHATSPFDWLLSDKGPFHRSQEYTDFVDRSRQGFSTRYKIYRYEAKGKQWQRCLP
ncbi:Protein FAM5C [Bos mutus]|uniref:Protein FAM5C n=1 Tax=Bos mutus TaxID=72004 RepID=L8HNC5_9CETA|nr:Protein FAM5C [Bos mutus]